MSTIMVVDDTPDNIKLLELTLNESYNIVTATSGQECLDNVNESQPDLILLDVRMPNMNGYEVCKSLKANPDTSLIPIIFVSAGDSLQEKISGYEAGGEDYVTKPFQEQEIVAKIKASLANREVSERLRVENQGAKETAFTALNAASELGVIIRFLQDSGVVETFDDLMLKFFEATEFFGLNCCAQIHTARGKLCMNCDSDSLAAQILEKMIEQGKIIDFGARTIINEDSISLLIKNMPINDEDKYGRIKDNVTVLLNGANSRIKSLMIENELNEQREGGLHRTIKEVHEEIKTVNEKFSQHEKTSSLLMSKLRGDLEQLLLTLGLTEEQEKVLLERVDFTTDEIHALNYTGVEIDEGLANIANLLSQLLQH